MCLYPKLIKNGKYKSNKKNGGIVPAVSDPRVLYVPVGCGNCMECRSQKAREWKVRLNEEIKYNTNGKFITLTFSNESISQIICENEKLKNLYGYELDNAIATRAIRLFLERWRKKYKKSLRHWLVTELGHEGTENIHMHGIVWTDKTYDEIKEIWKYGFIWPTKEEYTKTYVCEDTVNYTVKYIHKVDLKHKHYKSLVLTSPGIGANYTNTYNSQLNKYKNVNTIELYRMRNGYQISLPVYYRNKIYTDEEKEKLWLQRLDKNERWVNKQKVKADDHKEYLRLLNHHRMINKQLGYGSDYKDLEELEYEKNRRDIMNMARINNTKFYKDEEGGGWKPINTNK